MLHENCHKGNQMTTVSDEAISKSRCQVVHSKKAWIGIQVQMINGFQIIDLIAAVNNVVPTFLCLSG